MLRPVSLVVPWPTDPPPRQTTEQNRNANRTPCPTAGQLEGVRKPHLGSARSLCGLAQPLDRSKCGNARAMGNAGPMSASCTFAAAAQLEPARPPWFAPCQHMSFPYRRKATSLSCPSVPQVPHGSHSRISGFPYIAGLSHRLPREALDGTLVLGTYNHEPDLRLHPSSFALPTAHQT